MLRADAQRQVSMLRQEMVTELLSLVVEVHEPAIRHRLTRLIESQLRSGLAAARKSEHLWPSLEEAQEAIGRTDLKPTVQKRHLKFFERLDRVQRRAWGLLNDSFSNVQVILDRLQAAARPEPIGRPRNPASSGTARPAEAKGVKGPGAG